MRTLRLPVLLALLAVAPAAAQTPATAQAVAPVPDPTTLIPSKLDYDSLAFGRQVTNWFYASQVDSLWAHTSPAFQAQMESKDRWSAMFGEFIERVGMELEVVEEKFIKRNGKRQYYRAFRAAEFTEEPVVIRWVLEPGQLIGGAGMNPLSRTPPVDP